MQCEFRHDEQCCSNNCNAYNACQETYLGQGEDCFDAEDCPPQNTCTPDGQYVSICIDISKSFKIVFGLIIYRFLVSLNV